MPREIAKFRALEPLTIKGPNGRRAIGVGEIFEFEGRPGAALMPINEAARKNKLRAIVDGPGPHRPVEPTRRRGALATSATTSARPEILSTSSWLEKPRGRRLHHPTQGTDNMPIFIDPKNQRNPQVVVDDAWPNAGLVARPNDATAAAIISYRDRFQDHPDFPPSPWDDRVGNIFLPDLDGDPRRATDPLPRYTLKENGFVGCNLYMAGQEIDFPGWPSKPHLLEPANASAELVLGYMTKHGAGRTLPGMPHAGGVLNLPNPATITGMPVGYQVRRSSGDLRPA